MTSIWGMIAYIIFKIVVWIVNKMGADKATQKALEEFLNAAVNNNKSVALMKAAQKQLDWLKKNPWKERPVKK